MTFGNIPCGMGLVKCHLKNEIRLNYLNMNFFYPVVPPMSPFSEAVAAAVNPYLVDNTTPSQKTQKASQNSATTVTLHSVPDSSNITNYQQSSPGSSSTPKRPILHRELSREDMDLEVNTVQKDLDHLKDMLSGQITLDSSLISNLFNPDESLSSLFGNPDLNLGPFSPSSLNPTSSSSGLLQPLEMETPATKDAVNAIITSASAAQPSAGNIYTQANVLEDQPPLFEFEDIDDMDEHIDVGGGDAAGEKQKTSSRNNISISKIPIMKNDDLSLNTPLISSGDDQDNPLIRSIINRKKK